MNSHGIRFSELWNAGKVADYLEVSVRTIWRWDKEEKFPRPEKLGCRKRWHPEDIRLWRELNCPNCEEFEQLKKEKESSR